MTNVMLPKYIPCSKQPQGSVEINWGSPLTNGLKAVFDVRIGRELVTGTQASTDAIARVATQTGVGADFDGTSAQKYPHHKNFAITGDISIVVYCDVDALTNYGALIGKQSATTLNVPYELRLGLGATDSHINLLRANDSGYVQRSASFSNIISAGTNDICMVATARGLDANGSLYTPSKLGSGYSFAGNGTGSATDNGADVWIGRRFDGATKLDGRIYYVALYDRILAAEEARLLIANPWQLFHQRVQLPQNVTTKENRKPIIRESNMLGTSKRKLSDVNLLEVLRKPMMKQPQGRAEVDWGNPLTRGLVVVGNYAQASIDAASGAIVSHNRVVSAGPVGLGIGGTSGLVTYPNGRLINSATGPGQPRTVFFLLETTTTSNTVIAEKGSNENFVCQTLNGKFSWRVAGDSTGKCDTTSNITSGLPVAVAGTFNGSQQRVYFEGRHEATSTPGAADFTNTLDFVVGARAGNLYAFPGRIYIALVWNRALSDAEIASISVNPWQIFHQSSNLPLLK